jgi:hypothetical protein
MLPLDGADRVILSTMRSSALIGTTLVALYAGQAFAQGSVDPLSVENFLIRRQIERMQQEDAERQQQHARELFYERLSDGQVMSKKRCVAVS